MGRVVLILVAGVTGGLLAKKIGFPGGPVVGSMLGAGITAIALPGSVLLPAWGATAVQVLLGISLGMSFDRSFLALGVGLLPVAVFSTLVLLAVSVGMALLATRLGIVDFATALFGFSPGGMSGMSLLAQSEGYSSAVVAFFHTVRIFTLFLLVPLVGRLTLLRFRGL